MNALKFTSALSILDDAASSFHAQGGNLAATPFIAKENRAAAKNVAKARTRVSELANAANAILGIIQVTSAREQQAFDRLISAIAAVRGGGK